MSDQYRKTGEYRGYRYMVRRTEDGTVCCYVDVQRSAAFRATYARSGGVPSAADALARMHGGVTYFGRGFPGDDPSAARLTVGCDYGHWGDTPPGPFEPDDISSVMRSVISERAAEEELMAVIDGMVSVSDL